MIRIDNNPLAGEQHLLSQTPQIAAADPMPFCRPMALQRLPAGFPSPAEDYQEGQLDLNVYLTQHKASSYYFTVEGNSMTGAGIHPGDKVLVDRLIEPQHGCLVVAVVDGAFTLKRLFRRGQVVELRAENPQYPPIRFSDEQTLEIWGVVVGLVRKYRP